MADLQTTRICDMTDAELRQAIAGAWERTLVVARRRWRICGFQAYPAPEDLVNGAVEALLKLTDLPDWTVEHWLKKKILNLSTNAARKAQGERKQMAMARGDGADAVAREAPAGPVGWDRAIGHLNLAAAGMPDGPQKDECRQVIEAWKCEIFSEGEIAAVTNMDVAKVRAATKRIRRMCKNWPEYVADAVNAELGRS